MWLTWLATVFSLMKRSLAIVAVRLALREQDEHLELALGEPVGE